MNGRTRYARQLAERRLCARVRELAYFGQVMGWTFVLGGAFGYYCLTFAPDAVLLGAMLLGGLFLLLAVAVPQALEWPQRGWAWIGHWQGRILMAALLSAVYFLIFWPVGWWQRRKGAHPFYRWGGTRRGKFVAWEPLDQPALDRPAQSRARGRSLVHVFVYTLAFFFRRGHYVALPILLLLLILGLLLFFAQTSALAPFIYTLF